MATRTRTREVTLTKSTKALAVDFYKNNQLANEHASKAKKSRAELFSAMKDEDVSEASFQTTIEGKKVILSSVISEGRTTTVIDTDKLKKLVSPEIFDKIVTATVTNVNKYAGSNIVDQCGTKKSGSESVTVKPVK